MNSNPSATTQNETKFEVLTLELKPLTNPAVLGHLEKSLESIPAVESVEIEHGSQIARITHSGVDFKEVLRVIGVHGCDAHFR